MKMTRLEWRYLQRIALDHPYFDTHKLPLTEREAKAIVEANIRMTGKEFVDSIYAKLGMTRPQEEKKRFARLRGIGEQLTVPPIRKIAITVLVVLLMTVFFAAAPVGRAIAESVIQYVVSLFDGGNLRIERKDNELFEYHSTSETGQNDAIDPDMETVRTGYVNNFDAFTELTGKTPIILSLPYEKLFYEIDDLNGATFLTVEYETASGRIVTYQIWNTDVTVISNSTGYEVYNANRHIYSSIDDDGTYSVVRVLDDSIFSVYSFADYSIKELVKMVEDY